jgi:hypothetical protein
LVENQDILVFEEDFSEDVWYNIKTMIIW